MLRPGSLQLGRLACGPPRRQISAATAAAASAACVRSAALAAAAHPLLTLGALGLGALVLSRSSAATSATAPLVQPAALRLGAATSAAAPLVQSAALRLGAAASAAAPLVQPAALRLGAAASAAAALALPRCAPLPLPAPPQPAALLASAGWRETPPAEAAAACEALLRTAVRTPFSTYTRAGLYTVELAAPRPSAPALVLLSGYSSGSGLYFRALDHLAAHYHVFCVDVLGTGASERPPFTARTAEEAEAFFVDSLEGWRAASPPLSSTPFTLLGHSLGGFLVGAYALRHPQAVAHLILVNAAGLPAQADARIAAARERHWAVGAVGWAWDMGVTPGALVRAMGPYSQAAVEGMVTRRFSWHAPVPPELHRYIHAILTAQGSGEFALNRLMEFGAHARLPLGPRLLQSWKGRITVLHGERDWLDVRESAALVKGLQGLGVDAEFVSVPGAEHYVFLERPQAFVQSLLQRA